MPDSSNIDAKNEERPRKKDWRQAMNVHKKLSMFQNINPRRN